MEIFQLTSKLSLPADAAAVDLFALSSWRFSKNCYALRTGDEIWWLFLLLPEIKLILFFLGKFRQFDYGAKGNLAQYGQYQPPDYDLSKVTCPVYIYYAENDWLVHKSVGYRASFLDNYLLIFSLCWIL
jgi:hypothetical protein